MKTKTITVDLEAYSQPCVLGTTTGGIHPGEMMVITAGRRTGKSMYMQTLNNRIYNTNRCKEIMLPISYDKPKYKFSRAKWYTAEINDNSLWRMSKEYNNVIEWCTEQFGPHPKNKDAWSRWWVGLGYIRFRDEKDYMLYQLKWQ
jgi:hypothetical protein